MKNIKRIAGALGGICSALLASPLTAMAATQAAQAEEKSSLGETILKALLNTVMGISIVFLALLLIAWIISLFKYINKFSADHAAKQKESAASAVPAAEPVAEQAEEELSDDLELVAVVTAAIHAYEESQGNDVPADGLVVRSIRRANRAGWQNA